MEKQRWEESEKRRSEKRKSEKKEDAGARKGRKVAKHCVFPMICGSGGSKSRLAKAAGAEPCGQMRNEKLHAVVARSTFPSQNNQHVQSTPGSEHFWKLWCRKCARRCGAKHISKSNVQNTPGLEHFWKLRCRKSAGRCGAKHISKSKCTNTPGSEHFWKLRCRRSTFPSQNAQRTPCSEHFWNLGCRKSARRCGANYISKPKVLKTDGLGALLDVQMWFCVAGTRDCAPCQKWAKREGFLACPKALAGVGHLKRIWKDAFSVAGAIKETCSSEMLGGQGADFLREVAFWSIRSSVSGRWFCVTGAALCMTWHHFFVAGAILQRHGLEKLQIVLARSRQLCIQLSIILVEGSLAELLCFADCR